MPLIEPKPERWKGPPIENGGGPPHNGDMEARVARLEEFAQEVRDRLARLETRAENFATKHDVSEAKNSIIMWVVGAIFLAQLLPALLKKIGL